MQVLPFGLSGVKQEKLTNSRTKAADVLDEIFALQTQCESNEYFGAFATTMTS